MISCQPSGAARRAYVAFWLDLDAKEANSKLEGQTIGEVIPLRAELIALMAVKGCFRTGRENALAGTLTSESETTS
jgi:hypothetical protein